MSVKGATRGQVHRFRDYVALYLGEGETVYLTKEQARSLANAINGAARDIESRGFSRSRFETFHLPQAESGE